MRKEQTPKKIIMEGFWSMNKTKTTNELASRFRYQKIDEPNHLSADIIRKKVGDIDDLYIKRHEINLKKIYSNNKMYIAERSILGSAAFLYAIKNQRKECSLQKTLNRFVEFYKQQKTLIVFLYANDKVITEKIRYLDDPRVKKLLAKKEFISRYNEYFHHILPMEYGLPILCINIERNNIINNIEASLKNNRLAQINVTCYKIDSNQKKFLLLKRNKRKGGFWQTITGGVKLGFLLEQAAQIELLEETGIRPNLANLYKINYNFSYIGSEGYELNEYAFGCDVSNIANLKISEEHTEYGFFNLKESLVKVKYQHNKNIIKEISKKG